MFAAIVTASVVSAGILNGSKAVGANPGDLQTFEERCVKKKEGFVGKYDPVDDPKCQWQVDGTDYPCYPVMRKAFADISKFSEVPITNGPSCLYESKDSKCPLTDAASQEPGGCFEVKVCGLGSCTTYGHFYEWQTTTEAPTPSFEDVNNGWVAKKSLTTEQCKEICGFKEPAGQRLNAEATSKRTFGFTEGCFCQYESLTFTVPESNMMLPCDVCGSNHESSTKEMRHTPGFGASLGGSLGGLVVAFSYIVILSR